MTRKLFIAGMLLMAFAASGAATRSSEKMQVVYREQLSGEWQVFVFGPFCPTNMKLRLIEPTNQLADPIKIQCYYPNQR